MLAPIGAAAQGHASSTRYVGRGTRVATLGTPTSSLRLDCLDAVTSGFSRAEHYLPFAGWARHEDGCQSPDIHRDPQIAPAPWVTNRSGICCPPTRYLEFMADSVPTAVAFGGPLDGHVLGASKADHYDVTMQDLTVHRYLRTDRREHDAVLCTYAGRI